jgi:hypothetical protein
LSTIHEWELDHLVVRIIYYIFGLYICKYSTTITIYLYNVIQHKFFILGPILDYLHLGYDNTFFKNKNIMAFILMAYNRHLCVTEFLRGSIFASTVNQIDKRRFLKSLTDIHYVCIWREVNFVDTLVLYG